MQMEETESFEYLSNVLNWKAEPFVGQRPLCPSVQFGPYNLAELIDAVKSAADASGFATYAFRGARKSAASCSIKFGCDHGRLRYGKEKVAISKKNQRFCQRYAGSRSRPTGKTSTSKEMWRLQAIKDATPSSQEQGVSLYYLPEIMWRKVVLRHSMHVDFKWRCKMYQLLRSCQSLQAPFQKQNVR